MIIEDGTGTGKKVAVTENNRLKTTGVDLTLNQAATEAGDTYNINTDVIGLTSNGESALFYVKNNEDTDMLIDAIIVNFKNFVGTGGQPTLKIYRNPTNGTLITANSIAVQSNRNYGSSQTFNGSIIQGVEGNTFTGQDAIIEVFLPTTDAVTLIQFETLIVLPKGSSVGISYTPPTGITTMDIVVAVNALVNGTQL